MNRKGNKTVNIPGLAWLSVNWKDNQIDQLEEYTDMAQKTMISYWLIGDEFRLREYAKGS
jgi:hypothetical protein